MRDLKYLTLMDKNAIRDFYFITVLSCRTTLITKSYWFHYIGSWHWSLKSFSRITKNCEGSYKPVYRLKGFWRDVRALTSNYWFLIKCFWRFRIDGSKYWESETYWISEYRERKASMGKSRKLGEYKTERLSSDNTGGQTFVAALTR